MREGYSISKESLLVHRRRGIGVLRIDESIECKKLREKIVEGMTTADDKFLIEPVRNKRTLFF
jgi:hypothetical protein